MILHLGLKINLFIAAILGIKKIKISKRTPSWIRLTAMLYSNVNFVFIISMFLLFYFSLTVMSLSKAPEKSFMSLKFVTKILSYIRFLCGNIWLGLSFFVTIYEKIYEKSFEKCLRDTCSFIRKLSSKQKNNNFTFTFLGFLLSLFYMWMFYIYKPKENVMIFLIFNFYTLIYLYTSVHLLNQACLFWSLLEQILSAVDCLRNKALLLEELELQSLLIQRDNPNWSNNKESLINEIKNISFGIQKILEEVFSVLVIPISLIFITNLIYPVNEVILSGMNFASNTQNFYLISCIFFNFILLCSCDAVTEKIVGIVIILQRIVVQEKSLNTKLQIVTIF
ncbi:hypothetical protein Avbf_07971 [Armadillidium vulgare]|nr:hypothetical protein Avbf_07971 [Armadillidium vulgare]